MNTKNAVLRPKAVTPLCALLIVAGMGNPVYAGDETAKGGIPPISERGSETQMDLPGSFHKYYGQNVNYYIDGERKVAKLDLDGDLNYDGIISNEDPADNGAFQNTPPGLVVGVGELSKLVLRLQPYRIDYQGDVVVTLEVAGINRANPTGRFGSFEEEQASVGRIRVWQDAAKTKLLLDSGRSDMLAHEFLMDANTYPANLPGTVPRTLYVEGVSPSGQYSGDLRVLTTVTHRAKGATAETFSEDRKRMTKTFRTTFDHLLFTVKSTPMKKDFVNNNSEGVWIKP